VASLLLSPSTGDAFSAQAADASPFQAWDGAIVRVPTTSGAFVVRAPAGAGAANGQAFAVLDVDGDAPTNPIVIDGNGLQIDGAGTLTLVGAGELAVFVSVGTEWRRTLPVFSVDGATAEDTFTRFLPPADSPTNVDAKIAVALATAEADATTKANAAEAAAVATASLDATTKANAAEAAAVATASLDATTKANAAEAAAEAYADGLVTSPAIGGVRGTALDANHIHAWELTELVGTTFADTGSSAQKVTLTMADAANVRLGAAGLFGPCPFFGATALGGNAAARADALISGFNDLPTINWTIEAWAQLGSIGTSQVNALVTASDASAINVQLAINGSTSATMALTARTTTFLNGSGNANLFNTIGAVGSWHFYALVYDGAALLAYVDGELVGRVAGGSTATQWTSGVNPRFVIANQLSATAPMYGRLSRVRLSNIARSQAYLRSVYQTAQLLAA